MLKLVTSAAIIGAIFVLSPARTETGPLPSPEGAGGAALPPALSAGGVDLAAAERTWRSLPDGTRQRLLKLLAGAAGAEQPASHGADRAGR